MSTTADLLYDRYLDDCLSGCAVDPEEYCRLHPEVAGLRDSLVQVYALMRTVEPRKRQRPSIDVAPGLPFERLDGFRLLRPLDHGGMGMVFLAEQETLGRLVALKLIRPELRHSPTATERFHREAQAIARLDHPNIVSVHAMGEDQGVRYIAMEFVAGENLDRALSRGATPTAQAVRWALALARALEAAHAIGVIHRDVKPSNVRITAEDEPVLLDFGIARDTRLESGTLTRAFTGSPLYAAPEQIAGEKVDGRADIYSLGVTLFQCLTGRTPFSEGDAFTRVLNEDPPSPRRFNPAVARDLEMVVLKALARNASDRYETAALFAEDLQALLEFRPVTARPPHAWRRLRDWSRRRPGRSAAIATLLIATLAVGVLLIAREQTRLRQRGADAREAVANARTRIEEYQTRRAATEETERKVVSLQKSLHAKHSTEEEDLLLRRMEREVADLRREREETFYGVLDLLRRAEGLDPDVAGADAVRAELFGEKWHEARVLRDSGAMAFYERRIEEYDGERARGLRPRFRVNFTTHPEGATVHLFRMQVQSEVLPDGEERLVPVPVALEGEPILPRIPGTELLRVVRGAGSIEAEDLLLTLAGHEVAGALIATEESGPIRPGDRLLSIGGKGVRGIYDVEQAGKSGSFEFARGEERILVPTLPPLAPCYGAAEKGGLRAEVFHEGTIVEHLLPVGLIVRATAAPLFPSPACRLGTTPLEVDLTEGPYCFLVTLPGHEPARFVSYVARDGYGSCDLAPLGTTPPGYVRVARHQIDVPGFWIMEREVTAQEYGEFLNDPETLRLIAAAPEKIFVPRDSKMGQAWWHLEDGRYLPEPDWQPEWPVVGISFLDATAYAAWRTAREKKGVYRLPTWAEWSAAAQGNAPRVYPFGDHFHAKWMKSCYARPVANLEPVLRFPVDESPLGVFDMAGGAAEWVDDWYDKNRGLRRAAGGAWGQAAPERFALTGHGYRPDYATGDFGVRLVWDPKG